VKAERRKGAKTQGSEERVAKSEEEMPGGSSRFALRSSQLPALPPIDRTPKLYIGGKQARPDGGYALPFLDASGNQIASVGRGNRKDIRNAVEAAHKAEAGWAGSTAHTR